MSWQRSTAIISVLLMSQSLATIIEPPQNAVYRNGVDTTGYVSCIVNVDQQKSLFWIGTQVIYSSSQSFLIDNSNGKYSINDDAGSTGNYTLVINRLARNDSGLYKCQYGRDAKAATLTVAGE